MDHKVLVSFLSSLFLSMSAIAAESIDDLKAKCDNSDFVACTTLADKYVNGDDVKDDFIQADKLYEKACTFGKVDAACKKMFFNKGAISRIKSYVVPPEIMKLSQRYFYANRNTDLEEIYSNFKDYCEKNKDLRACALYGEMKIQGHGTRRTVARGIKLLEASCAEGDVYACSNLGFRFFTADEIEPNEFLAFKLLNYACQNGEFPSCRFAAAFYENDIGVAHDQDKIEYLYSKACDNADAVSCQKLARIYLEKEKIDDRRKSIEVLQRGCDFGGIKSCQILGDVYFNGELVPKDDKKGCNLYKKSCDGNEALGCLKLGQCYSEGYGVKQSRMVARNLFSKACELGSDDGCEALTQIVNKSNEKKTEQPAME